MLTIVGRRSRLAAGSPGLTFHQLCPPEVGRVPLAEVCSLGARHYVEAFDDFLKSPSEWRPVRSPRVMVSDSCWGEVCTGLVSSGVCVWLEESEVFQVDDSPLLNGLFGVSKDDFTDEGVEIFRLIMVLRPLNALCMPISGRRGNTALLGKHDSFFPSA